VNDWPALSRAGSCAGPCAGRRAQAGIDGMCECGHRL